METNEVTQDVVVIDIGELLNFFLKAGRLYFTVRSGTGSFDVWYHHIFHHAKLYIRNQNVRLEPSDK